MSLCIEIMRVGGFGKDRGEETKWGREGVGGSFQSGYGFAWFEEDEEARVAE
jgi:hypothetical protein